MVRFSWREGIENQCILAGELCLMVRFSWREGIENQCGRGIMVRFSCREGIENQLCLMVAGVYWRGSCVSWSGFPVGKA